MDRRRVVRAVEAVADLAVASADRAAIEAGLAEAERVRRWLAARDASMRQRLAELSAWPEKNAADATGADLVEAERAARRAEIVARFAAFGDAMQRGEIAPEHLDALERVLRSLDDATRARVTAMGDHVVELAAGCSPREFARRLRREAGRLRGALAAEQALAGQEQARRLRLWLDEVTGMVHLSGAFDPVAGMALWRALDQRTESLHAGGNVDGAPSDPRDRQAFLRALALLDLTGLRPIGDPSRSGGDVDHRRPAAGRATVVVVVDTTPDEHGVARVDWGLPVDLPLSLLQRVLRDAALRGVMIRNGVVSDPTGVLDHGRHRRLASTEQRHALRALYATCAIPGCGVPFERCRIHHVTAWEDGGPTDLHNLLPVCAHHHRDLHERGWRLHLAADRSLTISTVDGTRTTTGPPRRAA